MAVLVALVGAGLAGDRALLLHDSQSPSHRALLTCREAIRDRSARIPVRTDLQLHNDERVTGTTTGGTRWRVTGTGTITFPDSPGREDGITWSCATDEENVANRLELAQLEVAR